MWELHEPPLEDRFRELEVESIIEVEVVRSLDRDAA
jgi:hypothetical protein